MENMKATGMKEVFVRFFFSSGITQNASFLLFEG